MTTAQYLSQVLRAMRRGDIAEAERLCRSLLDVAPRDFAGWFLLGGILLRSRRLAEAVSAYETASSIDAGYGGPFSRAAMLRFRMAFGRPPTPRSPTEKTRGRVQKTNLGSHGRFGNQLLQYAFIRLHASEHNLTAELPDWIGRDLFDLDDPLPSAALPLVHEKDFDLSDALSPTGRSFAGHDVSGFFCGSTAQWGDRAAEFRALYTPGKKLRILLDQVSRALDGAGKTVVAIHIRHGDFGYGRYWIAPAEWYLAWLRAIWPRLDAPVLYVATDDNTIVAQFAEFSPWDARRLGVRIPGADFMIDHHVLRNAAKVAISNSTFSFTAAMLNERALTFVRPHPNRRELVSFDPWASPVLLDPIIETSETTALDRAVLAQHFLPGDSVVHVGPSCTPWTHLARSVSPKTRIHELGERESVDQFFERRGQARVTHLVVDWLESIASIAAGASETLSRSGVDILHFRVPSGGVIAMPRELTQNGYELFVSVEGALRPTDGTLPLPPGYYVALHERAKARLKP